MLIEMFYLSLVSSDVRRLDDAKYGGLGLFVAYVGGKGGFASRRGA